MSKESRAWAPSRWTLTKRRLFLLHMRHFLKLWPVQGSYQAMGVTDAIMSIDLALSELAMMGRKSLKVVRASKAPADVGVAPHGAR